MCLTHAAFSTGHYTDDFAGHLWARFEIGVPIFFALSGFLLFRPWVRLLEDGTADERGLKTALIDAFDGRAVQVW